VYFARPDSRVFGRDVRQTRLALGRQLAREAPADADVVVPFSGNYPVPLPEEGRDQLKLFEKARE
jgi:amidophosphoribosyltransferase